MKNPNFEDYYGLAEKLAKEGDLEGAIACYHRVIALNPDLPSKCFLDDLEAINFLRIKAKELSIIPGNNVEETSEGYLSLKDNQGFVFYGPYIHIPDGLYRVRIGFNFPENSLEMTEEKDYDHSFKFDIVSPHPYVLYETKVDSHQTSLEFYLDFIEGHRTEFRFFSTGSAFSVSCIEMTLVYQPEPDTNAAFLYYFNLGCILQFKGQREKANQAYSRAVEYSPTGSLIDSLVNDQYILTFSPVAEEVYLSLAVLLEKKERWEEAIACYRKVLEITPNQDRANYKLSVILAAQGQLDEALICFQKAQRQPSEAEIYEKIWKGLNQLASLQETDIDNQAEIKLEDASIYFTQTSKYTVMKMVSLTDLSESDKTFLEAENFLLANLELIKQDSLGLEDIYINQFEEFKGINLSKKNIKKSNFSSWNLLNATNDFQQSIVETGYIYSACPFTGKVLRSNSSFYLQPSIGVTILIYQFQSREIFYLIVGGWGGVKICVYFPRLELIIKLSNEWTTWVSPEENINIFKAHAVSFWPKFKSYLSNEKTKEVVAIVANIPNLGHYFWNQISGLYHLYENNLLHKIDKFLIGSNEYLEIDAIFPEIPPEKIVRYDNNNLFRAILDNNYFAVLVTHSFIKEDLAIRIQTTAVNKCSQPFLQNVQAAKKHFPLLWINLRSHNKAWISQVEGYANIITKIFEDYPGMAVVFDGFHTEKANMEQIQALISLNVKVYNALECPVHETIVWAGTVDTYIAVIGSGLTLVTWIANKPGVAHSDRGHYSQLPWWLEVRENLVDIVPVPVEHIINVTTSKWGWENYDCDWKVIYDEVIKVVKNLDKSQEQPQLIENELTQNDLTQLQLEPATTHQEYLKLDIGCGNNKKPGTIGLDCCEIPGVVDHVLNLQTDTLPFADRSVEYVHSSHTLQDLTDPIHLFQEISRVCIDGAKLELWIPYVCYNNSTFIYGQKNYYQEDSYMHLCVGFAHVGSVSLAARWYLNEIVYVVPPHILIELYKQKIPLEFAIRYYKGVVLEFAAIIEVRHEDKEQTIYPQRSFATSRLGHRYLLPSAQEIVEEEELLEAINWFSAPSS